MNSVLNCPARDYFQNKEHFDDLVGVVNRKYKITLKCLEYTARNAGYLMQRMDLQSLYEDFLSGYGKRSFDCFRRHRAEEITRFGATITTNISQMRFIRFAKISGILKFLRNQHNVKRVEKLMANKSTFTAIGSFTHEYTFFGA